MLVPVALLAEREQLVEGDEFLTAEADGTDVVHLERDAPAAAFAASACPGTHLLA